MKITIVGNGKISKKYGKSIDSSDIVIRFNHAITDGYEEYYGMKTDVLGLVGETSLSYVTAFDRINSEVLRKCKKIIFTGKKKNTDYEKLLNKKGVKEYEYIGFEFYKSYCVKIIKNCDLTKIPSTGINTLCYILDKYSIFTNMQNKLEIVGFDAFKTGHYSDNVKRNNIEFHNLDIEVAIIESLRQYKNITIIN